MVGVCILQQSFVQYNKHMVIFCTFTQELIELVQVQISKKKINKKMHTCTAKIVFVNTVIMPSLNVKSTSLQAMHE